MISTLILLLPLAIVAVFLFSIRPVCGAYDPIDYRCGKCDRCRQENA